MLSDSRPSEHDVTLFPRFPVLERSGGEYRLPAGHPRIPLMYSLRAIHFGT